MDAKAAIADLLKTVEDIERAGTLQIEVAKLAALLRSWNKQIIAHTVISAEERHHQLEVYKIQSTAASANLVEMFKAVIEAGQTAVKSATIINGGAAAALLALLAEALKAGPTSTAGTFLSPLGWAWFTFMAGLGLAGAATAARYVSQALYAHSLRSSDQPIKHKFNRFGDAGRNTAIAFGLSSYLCFFGGSVAVLKVMVAPPTFGTESSKSQQGTAEATFAPRPISKASSTR